MNTLTINTETLRRFMQAESTLFAGQYGETWIQIDYEPESERTYEEIRAVHVGVKNKSTLTFRTEPREKEVNSPEKTEKGGDK